jgi:hypothetical protein
MVNEIKNRNVGVVWYLCGCKNWFLAESLLVLNQKAFDV